MKIQDLKEILMGVFLAALITMFLALVGCSKPPIKDNTIKPRYIPTVNPQMK